MSQAMKSLIDPNLITGLRDHLAATFSEKIGVVIPEISEFIEFESASIQDPEAKRPYLHAAQTLFSRRLQIVQAIAADYRTRFDAKLHADEQPLPRTRLSLDALSLVQDAEVEEDIVVNNCGNRLKEQSEYELFALTYRIGSLVGKDRIEDQDNPVYPRVFLRTLMHVLGEIGLDASVKLAAFKAFGPILLDIVPDTLTSANGWLAARGVDIDVDDTYGQPIITAERPFFPGPAPTGAGVEAGRVFADIVQRVLTPAVSTSAPTAVSPVEAAPVQTQGEGTALPIQAAGEAVTATPAARQVRSINQEDLSEDEALVADVVSVMFDQLHVDPRVPAVLKEIVARLEIPVLRVALADRTLFSNPQHPVRRLIDLIAEFGMTLDLSEKDQSTVDSVARVVEDIVQRHATDRAVFKLAYQRLDDMFYHHEESALQADPDIGTLQETEALECAQVAATAVVNARLNGRSLPPTIRAFIQIAWRDVLIRDYLDGGAAGKAWKLGIATLDELLKSVQPAPTREDRQKLAKSLPSLIDLIRDGTEHAEVHPRLVDECFVDLERLHERAVRGENTIDASHVELDFTEVPEVRVPELPSPSARLNQLGLACGAWIELRHSVIPQRWRLCWITPHKGTCVLKHYESRGRQVFSLEELGDQMLTGSAVVVENVGVTTTILAESFRVMARKARIEEIDARRQAALDAEDGQGAVAGVGPVRTGQPGRVTSYRPA